MVATRRFSASPPAAEATTATPARRLPATHQEGAVEVAAEAQLAVAVWVLAAAEEEQVPVRRQRRH